MDCSEFQAEVRAKEEAASKLEKLLAELAQCRQFFEEADAALTNALGRNALGEIEPAELKAIQVRHSEVASTLRGLMAGESLLKNRLREAEAAMEKARRAGINERAKIAAPKLERQINLVRSLAADLAAGIVLALQLDHAVTRESGHRTGQEIDTLFGGLFALMSARGVEISGTPMGPYFSLNTTPATLSKGELKSK